MSKMKIKINKIIGKSQIPTQSRRNTTCNRKGERKEGSTYRHCLRNVQLWHSDECPWLRDDRHGEDMWREIDLNKIKETKRGPGSLITGAGDAMTSRAFVMTSGSVVWRVIKERLGVLSMVWGEKWGVAPDYGGLKKTIVKFPDCGERKEKKMMVMGRFSNVIIRWRVFYVYFFKKKIVVDIGLNWKFHTIA